jgi:hypothetical protein
MNAIDYTVTGFETVTIAPGLACPACREALTVHAVTHDGITISVRCRACHTLALAAEPVGLDPEACDI